MRYIIGKKSQLSRRPNTNGKVSYFPSTGKTSKLSKISDCVFKFNLLPILCSYMWFEEHNIHLLLLTQISILLKIKLVMFILLYKRNHHPNANSATLFNRKCSSTLQLTIAKQNELTISPAKRSFAKNKRNPCDASFILSSRCFSLALILSCDIVLHILLQTSTFIGLIAMKLLK